MPAHLITQSLFGIDPGRQRGIALRRIGNACARRVIQFAVDIGHHVFA